MSKNGGCQKREVGDVRGDARECRLAPAGTLDRRTPDEREKRGAVGTPPASVRDRGPLPESRRPPFTLSFPSFYVILWREKEDWGWLKSLDGNQECTTQEPHRRLRHGTREAVMAALWKFRRDNPARDDERFCVARVRVLGNNLKCERG